MKKPSAYSFYLILITWRPDSPMVPRHWFVIIKTTEKPGPEVSLEMKKTQKYWLKTHCPQLELM